MRKILITDEMYASIPEYIAAGMTKQEIAKMFGVTPGTLQVLCCRRGISLRKGGPWVPPKFVTQRLVDEILPKKLYPAFRQAAKDLGIDEIQLVANLLETIAKDNLYHAILG